VVRWEWLQAMEASGSAVPSRGWTPHHLTLWRGDALVALAPAYVKAHSMGEYVYDFAWANAAAQFGIRYHPKLLINPPLAPVNGPRFHVAAGEPLEATRAALLQAALDDAKDSRFSSVHVLFPDEAEAAALEGLGLFRRASMQYHWKNPGYRTYDDYLARFDSKRRNQLKRERAAAAGQGITLRTLRGPQLGEREADLAAAFYEATSTRHSWGAAQLTRDFFRRVFKAMPGTVELVVAEREGKVIAGAFNLVTDSHLYGRYWGCFEEHPFLHFNVCLYHSIDENIGRGIQVFEPGAGGEHKISRGFVPTEVHSLHRIFHKGFESAVKDFCVREREQVTQVVRDGEDIAGLKPFVPPKA
jgi:predicted N-acyltransferase